MKFKYSFVGNLRDIKRTMTVVIAGITLAIASNASPVNLDNQKMICPDPLEQTIGMAENDAGPRIDYMELLRGEKLKNSIAENNGDAMNDQAREKWEKLMSAASGMPFTDVFAQYGHESESFFLSYGFDGEYRVDTTTYVDDDYVYFSIFRNGEIFLQNSLPENLFYEKVNKIWSKTGNGIS